MRTPADDTQLARHNFGLLAENVRLLSDALMEQRIAGPLHDALVLEWWKATLAPNLVDGVLELMQGLKPEEED